MTVSMTVPINKKQKKVEMKYLLKMQENSSLLDSLCVLLGFFALCYLSLSREFTGE